MATCPNGHDSAATDYCDVCGEPVAGGSVVAGEDPPTAPSAIAGRSPESAPAAPPATITASTCPNCGATVTGRFCEACGYDTALPAPAPPAPRETPPAQQAATGEEPAGWGVTVRADRAAFDRTVARNGPDAAAMRFPPYYPERRFPLRGNEMMIGKRDDAAGIHPDIDLRGNPEDPGVSRTHALLRATPDGSWEVLDIGSTNGTLFGDATEPLTPYVPIALTDGSSFSIGAWTVISVARS